MQPILSPGLKTGKVYGSLTNNFRLGAKTIADAYKDRRQIKIFSRFIKQNLKIKAFSGTFRNAMLIQIWTALIAYLLLVWLQFKSKLNRVFLEVTGLVLTMLQEHSDLWGMRNSREKAPPSQPFLFPLEVAG